MPKQKTHKGLRKRVKITATGKVKFRRPGHSHLMSGKTPKRRRQLHSSSVSTSTIAKGFKIKMCQ